MELKRRVFVAAGAVAALAGCLFDDETTESTSAPPDRAAGPADGDGGRNSRTATEDPEKRRAKDVPVVDAEANRSDYVPNSDQLFVADDTGAHYVGDGSQWQLVFEPTDSSGGSATNHVCAASYESIQNAIDDTNSGDVVWLQDGQTIDSTLTIDKTISLFGSASNIASWDQDGLWITSNVGGGDPVIHIDGVRDHGLHMKGFTILGNGSEGAGIAYSGRGDPYVDHSIENVMVSQVGGDGFLLQHLYGCEFENIRAQGCGGAGIHLHNGPSDVHNLTFYDPWAGQCQNGQILETSSNGSQFAQIHWHHPMIDGIDYDRNPLPGMKLYGGWGCSIHNPHIENPDGGQAIHIDGTKGGVRGSYAIHGGGIQSADTGIRITEGKWCLVDNLWFDSVGDEIVIDSGSNNYIGTPRGPIDYEFYDVTDNGVNTTPIGQYGPSTSNQRPTGDIAGRQIFDDETGVPAWWDGSQWVHADGSTL